MHISWTTGLLTLCISISAKLVLAGVVINEVNYDELDQTFEGRGSPGYEFVELYDGGAGNTPMVNHVLVRLNSHGTVTALFNLTDRATDQHGFFLIGGVYLTNRDMDQPGLMHNHGGSLILFKVISGTAIVDFINTFNLTNAMDTSTIEDMIVWEEPDGPQDNGWFNIISPGLVVMDSQANGNIKVLDGSNFVYSSDLKLYDDDFLNSTNDMSLSRCECCQPKNLTVFAHHPITPKMPNVYCPGITVPITQPTTTMVETTETTEVPTSQPPITCPTCPTAEPCPTQDPCPSCPSVSCPTQEPCPTCPTNPAITTQEPCATMTPCPETETCAPCPTTQPCSTISQSPTESADTSTCPSCPSCPESQTMESTPPACPTCPSCHATSEPCPTVTSTLTYQNATSATVCLEYTAKAMAITARPTVYGCGPPPVVPNAWIAAWSSNLMLPGGNVTYQCHHGFTYMDGDPVVICSTNMSWTQPPTCHKDCPKIPYVPNGTITGKSTTHHSSVNINCDNGFVMKPSTQAKCSSGEWHSDVPRCEALSEVINKDPEESLLSSLLDTSSIGSMLTMGSNSTNGSSSSVEDLFTIAWGEWVEWTACTASCGKGFKLRMRICFPSDLNCTANAIGIGECYDKECPIDGIWSEWTPWSNCSVTCDTGTISRFRECVGPFHGGRDCDGKENERSFCEEPECPNAGKGRAKPPPLQPPYTKADERESAQTMAAIAIAMVSIEVFAMLMMDINPYIVYQWVKKMIKKYKRNQSVTSRVERLT